MTAARRLALLIVLVLALVLQPAGIPPAASQSAAPDSQPSAQTQAPTIAEPVAAPAAPKALLTTLCRTLSAWANGLRRPSAPRVTSARMSTARSGPTRPRASPTHAYSPFDERRNREYPCPPGGCDFVKGQVLVKLAEDVRVRKGAERLTLTNDFALNSALSVQGVTGLEPIFPDAQASDGRRGGDHARRRRRPPARSHRLVPRHVGR